MTIRERLAQIQSEQTNVNKSGNSTDEARPKQGQKEPTQEQLEEWNRNKGQLQEAYKRLTESPIVGVIEDLQSLLAKYDPEIKFIPELKETIKYDPRNFYFIEARLIWDRVETQTYHSSMNEMGNIEYYWATTITYDELALIMPIPKEDDILHVLISQQTGRNSDYRKYTYLNHQFKSGVRGQIHFETVLHREEWQDRTNLESVIAQGLFESGVRLRSKPQQ